MLDHAPQDREPVIIARRNKAAIALIAADELDGLLTTLHLLRSPANAARLLRALQRAEERTVEPSTPTALHTELGLADE